MSRSLRKDIVKVSSIQSLLSLTVMNVDTSPSILSWHSAVRQYKSVHLRTTRWHCISEISQSSVLPSCWDLHVGQNGCQCLQLEMLTLLLTLSLLWNSRCGQANQARFDHFVHRSESDTLDETSYYVVTNLFCVQWTCYAAISAPATISTTSLSTSIPEAAWSLVGLGYTLRYYESPSVDIGNVHLWAAGRVVNTR